jgi:hypothetical protein
MRKSKKEQDKKYYEEHKNDPIFIEKRRKYFREYARKRRKERERNYNKLDGLFYFYGHYLYNKEYPQGVLRYVGWGTQIQYDRARQRHSSQKRWTDTFGYMPCGIQYKKEDMYWDYKIIVDKLSHDEANNYEMLFVNIFGRYGFESDGILANHQLGGGGCKRFRKTEKDLIAGRKKRYVKHYEENRKSDKAYKRIKRVKSYNGSAFFDWLDKNPLIKNIYNRDLISLKRISIVHRKGMKTKYITEWFKLHPEYKKLYAKEQRINYITLYNEIFSEADVDYISKKNREYRERNLSYIKKRRLKYNEENKDKINEYYRNYNLNLSDEQIEKKKLYYKEYRDKQRLLKGKVPKQILSEEEKLLKTKEYQKEYQKKLREDKEYKQYQKEYQKKLREQKEYKEYQKQYQKGYSEKRREAQKRYKERRKLSNL